uniref:HP domain-containing protein n=1 Tax=Ciona savignyi TaxID=51511 RepID=H2ZGP9_CIOSA
SRNKRSTRNPVKALAAREDIKQSYTEQRSNVSKLEQQRLASRGGNFTSAALAGLAHKADFSKVNLKSTTQPAFTANDLQPWSEKMLLRVKGRRHVQTRLVDPCCASLNSGDAYLLITPTQLFAWFGEFANVIEKAKVQEIADYIIHKGDMGSKATSLTIIEETQSTHLKSKPFFTLIGGEGKIEPYGGDKEDEIYEVNSEAAIKSYKLKDEKLVPHSEAWGKLPSMRMLDTKDSYVFDFGGEMYIWQGKEVSFSDRQLAVRLARTLWDQGYDYSDIGFCPFGPISSASINLKGPRPEWGVICENLETALIQEKFEDWSNISREVGDREEVSIKPEMVACDIKQMTSDKLHPLPLHLEGHNVWRGHGHIYDDDGRGLLVVTSAVDTWYATEKNMIKVEKPLHGVFHRSETYVVRWKYVVSSTGKWLASKSQPGVDLKAAANGRERTSYFLWAGRDSSVNEKGASALMATEIDKDGGAQVGGLMLDRIIGICTNHLLTQITVHEGREPPAFVQCFNGGMTVYKSICMIQVYKHTHYINHCQHISSPKMPCEFQSLRSRSSFILFNGRLAKIVVWHGVCSSKSTRELIMEAANKMKETKAECLGFRSSCKNAELSVCEEGKENADFSEGFTGLGGRNRGHNLIGVGFDHHSCNFPRKHGSCALLDTPDLTPSVPRAWHLLPSGDHFVAHELPPVLEYPSDENDKSEDVEIFPIIQEQLTELSKPALVLVDGAEGVFLWQSVGGEDMKGSGKRQFDISRRLAMETTINYCKEHRPNCTPMLINEKHEPMEFTNSFPVWLESKQKFSFEERKPKPVAEVLGSLSRLTYSLEELRAPSLPEGVDPNHLETYLSTEDFEKLFQITKEEFYAMPPWKQHNLRKEKDLF